MFSLKKVNKELIDESEPVWVEQMRVVTEGGGVILASRYLQALDWARRYSNGELGQDCHVYALLRTGEHSACALLEITHAMAGLQGAWLKVLRIHVEPRLDVGADDGIPPRELAEVASHALTKSLKLTFGEHPAGEMKVWGNTPLTTEFLEVICSLMGDADTLRVFTHGNWLVIRKAP